MNGLHAALLPQPTPASTSTAPTMVPLGSTATVPTTAAQAVAPTPTGADATTSAAPATTAPPSAASQTAEPPMEVEVHVTLGTTTNKSQKAPQSVQSPSATSKTWVRLKNVCKDFADAVRPKAKVGDSGASGGGNQKFLAKAASNLSKLGKARLLPITRSSTGVIA